MTSQRPSGGGLSLSGIGNWLLFFPLVCIYVVMVQFGSLFKSAAEDSNRGPSTFIVLILIALGIGRVVRAFMTETLLFWTLSSLALYVAMVSALLPDPLGMIFKPLELTGYFLLAAAISRTQWRPSQISTIWLLTAGALFVSSALTIVDFVGIIDVPYNNVNTSATKAAGLEVWQATGFFEARSTMAAYFGLTIAGSLVLALAHRSSMARLYYLTAASSGLLCLFLTHNRSGVLGAIAAIGLYALISPRFKGSRRIKILLGAAVAGVLLLAVAIVFFPDHLAVYVAKLGFIGLADQTWASDEFRLELFIMAVKTIVSNPLGNGFTKIPLAPGVVKGAHNVVTSIVWAAGLFAVVWIPLFTAVVYLSLRRRMANRATRAPLSVENDAIIYGLFAWLLMGMTHDIIFTGLAWVFFGILLSTLYFDDPAQQRRTEGDVSAAYG